MFLLINLYVDIELIIIRSCINNNKRLPFYTSTSVFNRLDMVIVTLLETIIPH